MCSDGCSCVGLRTADLRVLLCLLDGWCGQVLPLLQEQRPQPEVHRGYQATLVADAKSLALRLNSKTAESDGDIFYGNRQDNRDDDHDYGGEQWDGEEHEDWMSCYEEPWNEYEYYDSDYYAYDEEDYDLYPEEDWMWGAEEGAEGDPVDEAEETATEQKDEFYQKGKGRGSPSCFICGSKWHLATSCPVSQGKGKDGKSGGKGYRPKGFGKSKGYCKGKGRFRKGGFRPWSGKGKGKGKGYGKSKDGDRGWYYTRTQGLDTLRLSRPPSHSQLRRSPPLP